MHFRSFFLLSFFYKFFVFFFYLFFSERFLLWLVTRKYKKMKWEKEWETKEWGKRGMVNFSIKFCSKTLTLFWLNGWFEAEMHACMIVPTNHFDFSSSRVLQFCPSCSPFLPLFYFSTSFNLPCVLFVFVCFCFSMFAIFYLESCFSFSLGFVFVRPL